MDLPLKILMFGWEFPPYNSGGLGVACEGLVNGLSSLGARVTFVLPKKIDCQSQSCHFVFGENSDAKYRTVAVNSPLSPYLTGESYRREYEAIADNNNRNIWRKDLVSEVFRYAARAKEIAQKENADVIHCHDWLSVPAGIEAKNATGKPLVFQVHATEFDRVGQNCANREICAIEREGLERADMVVAVSDYTKRRIADCYGVDRGKITVVPNAVDHEKLGFRTGDDFMNLKKSGKKIALFVGRLTFQKGPDYFLRAAARVCRTDPNVVFVFSGSGDMERWLVEESARLGLADKVIFAGFLRGEQLNRLYRMADIYVMPSVSEPFGITSLEALANGAPILISRQSGVAEMVSHCLKVDFWDVDQIAGKILAATRYAELRQTLQENGANEVKKFSWVESAKLCLGVYRQALTA